MLVPTQLPDYALHYKVKELERRLQRLERATNAPEEGEKTYRSPPVTVNVRVGERYDFHNPDLPAPRSIAIEKICYPALDDSLEDFKIYVVFKYLDTNERASADYNDLVPLLKTYVPTAGILKIWRFDERPINNKEDIL
jgi:hypothetical protein